jgi:inner membrane protein
MPSIFSHAVVAVALGTGYPAPPPSSRVWLLSIACSILPDIDVVGHAVGIPYRSVWGHRGITHSFAFAAVLALAVVSLAFLQAEPLSSPWWSLVIYFFAVTASHPILDAMTNGGLGVAFFAPFENSRYFLPWRPIEVSPIDVRAFFTSRGLAVLQSEFVWLWIPSVMWIAAAWLIQRGR